MERFVVAVLIRVIQWFSGQHHRYLLAAHITNLTSRTVVVVRTPAWLGRCGQHAGPAGRRLTADEQPTERLSELLAHGAVDEEVDRVAEQYDEIDEQGRGPADTRIDQYERVE